MVARHIAEQQVFVPPMPERTFGENAARGQTLEGDGFADHAPKPLIADLDAGHDLPPAAAFFCSSLTRCSPTYQSSEPTSSNTTQMASFGSLATSLMVCVTRRAISSLRSWGWPLRMRMLTNGMSSSSTMP